MQSIQDLSPAVRYLVTIGVTQLKDELPFFDHIGMLEEADEVILDEERQGFLLKHALLRERIAQIRRDKE